MNLENATKKQLLQIALYEDCPLSFKYEALRELDLRKWSDIHLQKLLKYWGMGKTQDWIAEKLGMDFSTVGYYLMKYGLFKVRRGGMKL
jgi:hypothetical protein